jgi:protein SCO1/2
MREPFDPDRLLLAAAIGLAVFLVAGVLFAQPLPAGATLDAQRALDASQRALGRTLGDYALTATDGRAVRTSELRGKPLVVSFVYTGCSQVCPVTTKLLGRAVAQAQRTLGADAFNVVTIGFNQPFDTPAAMRDFQRRQGIDLPGWTFASADASTIDALARDAGFVWTSSAAGFDHVTQATIVDARGRIVRQVYGDAFELPLLVEPLKEMTGGARASPYDLASALDRVRILCTVYDPRAGRYRLNYALFIEIFAGLSILGTTAWYLLREWRRQRRAHAPLDSRHFRARSARLQ